MWHKIWRVLKPILEAVLAIVILAVLVVVPTLSGTTGPAKDNLNGFNESSQGGVGNTGPLTGDQFAFDQETSCMKRLAADPERHGGVLPGDRCCRTHRQRQVGRLPMREVHRRLQRQEPGVPVCIGDHVQPLGLVWFDGPSHGYLQANNLGPPSSSGQYVAKFNPATGEEIWRTPLTNINTTGQWIAAGSGAILADHTIVTAAGPRLWKIDPDTGDILATTQVPINPV